MDASAGLGGPAATPFKETPMRAALLLLALFGLSACNIVVTKAPLFTAADEAGAPPMKPGVWAFDDPTCTFDQGKPITQWPDCAGGAVFRPGEITGHDTKDGKDKWDHVPFVLAAGNPRIAQVMFQTEVSADQPHPAGMKTGDMPFGYAGVLPTASDGDGRITAITYWLVQCGPPPPPQARNNGRMALGTLHPLPGMVMKRGDPMCTTASRTALTAAAKASRAWADKPMKAHWVREPGPGDLPPR
jgi:hypothetical protein